MKKLLGEFLSSRKLVSAVLVTLGALGVKFFLDPAQVDKVVEIIVAVGALFSAGTAAAIGLQMKDK